MIRAGYYISYAAFLHIHQPIATMHADVEKGLDRTVFLFHHQDRFMHKFMGDEITRLFQLTDPSTDVPDLFPHMFPFALGKFR